MRARGGWGRHPGAHGLRRVPRQIRQYLGLAQTGEVYYLRLAGGAVSAGGVGLMAAQLSGQGLGTWTE
ncbi:MAG: hypothetical protein WKG07_22735 [Hymenobacter sp.]